MRASAQRKGPQITLECVGCKSRFNLVYLPGVSDTIAVAEELPSEADGGGRWRIDMFPKVLE